MDAHPLLLAVLLVAGPPEDEPPAPRSDTVLDWLAQAPVRSGLERLLEHAQYGLASYESAAWVVREKNGGVALREWAFTGAFERASWRGAKPRDAVAIVHTHPRAVDPRPSPGDAALARRIGMPVYALTGKGLWAARPDGSVVLEAAAPRVCSRLACVP